MRASHSFRTSKKNIINEKFGLNTDLMYSRLIFLTPFLFHIIENIDITKNKDLKSDFYGTFNSSEIITTFSKQNIYFFLSDISPVVLSYREIYAHPSS